jgi:hypothetical protein
VEDPFTSRLHAELRRRGDSFYISDLGSANGTIVNGIRLAAPVLLHDRDLIRIGETEIEYSERADTGPARRKTNILFAERGEMPRAEITIATGLHTAANLLSTLDRDESGRIAWITMTREAMDRSGASEEDSDNIINYPLTIGDVEAVAFFRELPNSSYRVSLRSKNRVNVARIAEEFGGGGAVFKKYSPKNFNLAGIQKIARIQGGELDRAGVKRAMKDLVGGADGDPKTACEERAKCVCHIRETFYHHVLA